MRRPLLVAHNAEAGGSNDVVMSMLAYTPLGVEPALMFLDDGPLLEEVGALGVPTRLIEAGRAREVWKAPLTVARIRTAIEQLGVDVVFAHVTKAHLYASPAARIAERPYLWWRHELPGQRRLQHAVAGVLPADRVICSSDFCAALQRARWQDVPVRRVYPGTRTTDAGPPKVHAASGDAPVIALVSRLQRWKRVERLLLALPAVLDALPATRVLIIGGATSKIDPDYPAELRALARELGVARAVEFCGHVPDAAARMSELDLLVHTAELEPFGLVIVEALLRGVPVVAPNIGGPAEIIRDGIDGLLVDPDDVEALSRAIVGLLRDPARRGAMGAAGRERVLERFDAARMARDAWAQAQEVSERWRRPGPGPRAARPGSGRSPRWRSSAVGSPRRWRRPRRPSRR